MVLQHAHRHPRAATPSLDTNRILGMSGTLAINVLAFLLLLMPMAGPPPLAVVEPQPSITVVPIEPLPPVTPRPPERVEVVQPQPRPQPVQRAQPAAAPAAEAVVVDQGTEWVEPTTDTASAVPGPPNIAPAGPLQGMRLEYARTPSPRYPREALRDGLQGTVLLQVLVDVDGRPLQVDVHASSGHRVLDQEAMRHVLRHWTFRPAMRDGRAVQAIGLVPIEFTLGRM